MGEKIVFLDFDGVIRVAVEGGWVGPDVAEFCQDRMRMLAFLCKGLGAKIVVSSDWHNFENEEEIRGILSPYLEACVHEDWSTPICGQRWEEIEKWIAAHDVNSYVIFDDVARLFDGCSEEMLDRLLLCSSRFGIVPSLIDQGFTKLS